MNNINLFLVLILRANLHDFSLITGVDFPNKEVFTLYLSIITLYNT